MAADKPNILVIWGDDIGRFGKSQFGDRDEMLPTKRGFGGFFGNLYRLDAEWPRGPRFL